GLCGVLADAAELVGAWDGVQDQPPEPGGGRTLCRGGASAEARQGFERRRVRCGSDQGRAEEADRENARHDDVPRWRARRDPEQVMRNSWQGLNFDLGETAAM